MKCSTNCCYNFCFYFVIVIAIIFGFFIAREPPTYRFPDHIQKDLHDWLYAEYILNEPKSVEWKTAVELAVEEEMMNSMVPGMGIFEREITIPGTFNTIEPTREITEAMAKRHGIPDHRFQRVVFILKPRVTSEGADFQRICHTDRGMPMYRIIESLTSSCIIFCEMADPDHVAGPNHDMCKDCYEKCSPFAFENTSQYHQFGPGNMTIAFDYSKRSTIMELRSIMFEVQLRMIHLLSNGTPFTLVKYPVNRILQAAGRNMWRDPWRQLQRLMGTA